MCVCFCAAILNSMLLAESLSKNLRDQFASCTNTSSNAYCAPLVVAVSTQSHRDHGGLDGDEAKQATLNECSFCCRLQVHADESIFIHKSV